MEIYLDHASTTPIHPKVIEKINESYHRFYANPSSVHEAGYAVRRRVENARKTLLEGINGFGYELVFTSGGTESNNTVIWGSAGRNQRKKSNWLCSAMEHPSVIRPYERLKHLGVNVCFLPCDAKGQVVLEALEKELSQETKMVSLMHVNNETGILQPLVDAIHLIRNKNPETQIHVDGVQAYGKIPLNMNKLDVDFYTLSAHKIRGPRGIGALLMKQRSFCLPLLWGGGQEKEFRSGTENVPGIVGFETAATLKHQKLGENLLQIRKIREHILQAIRSLLSDVHVIEAADENFQNPGILLLSLEGTRSEVLLRMLSDDQIYLSAGSACSSRKTAASHVLTAMGLSKRMIEGTLRISFDEQLSVPEIDRFTEQMARHVRQARKVMMR